ncbi:unnamed protein product, partial [marine sediment metagenome]
MKVLVFGGSGKMGSAVAWDLAKNSKVGEVGIIGITGRRENALEKTKKWIDSDNNMKAIVLGCGLIGGLIAKDLAKDKDFQVTVADIDEGKLNELTKETEISGIKADLSNSSDIKKIVADKDIVIGAVPGFLGFNMLRSVIEAGK